MAKKKKKQTRAEPVSYLCSMEAYETLCCSGYTSLADNPEIMAGVGKICDLISSISGIRMRISGTMRRRSWRS